MVISIIYYLLSFKRNRNEVNRTFLAPSNNYHASTSPKSSQDPEVCLRPFCKAATFYRLSISCFVLGICSQQFGVILPKYRFPYYILITKNSPKIGVKWLFLGIFHILNNLFSVFLCNSMSYNRFQSKMCQKVPNFKSGFRPKFVKFHPEMGSERILRNISKSRQFTFLELGRPF